MSKQIPNLKFDSPTFNEDLAEAREWAKHEESQMVNVYFEKVPILTTLGELQKELMSGTLEKFLKAEKIEVIKAVMSIGSDLDKMSKKKKTRNRAKKGKMIPVRGSNVTPPKKKRRK